MDMKGLSSCEKLESPGEQTVQREAGFFKHYLCSLCLSADTRYLMMLYHILLRFQLRLYFVCFLWFVRLWRIHHLVLTLCLCLSPFLSVYCVSDVTEVKLWMWACELDTKPSCTLVFSISKRILYFFPFLFCPSWSDLLHVNTFLRKRWDGLIYLTKLIQRVKEVKAGGDN